MGSSFLSGRKTSTCANHAGTKKKRTPCSPISPKGELECGWCFSFVSFFFRALPMHTKKKWFNFNLNIEFPSPLRDIAKGQVFRDHTPERSGNGKMWSFRIFGLNSRDFDDRTGTIRSSLIDRIINCSNNLQFLIRLLGDLTWNSYHQDLLAWLDSVSNMAPSKTTESLHHRHLWNKLGITPMLLTSTISSSIKAGEIIIFPGSYSSEIVHSEHPFKVFKKIRKNRKKSFGIFESFITGAGHRIVSWCPVVINVLQGICPHFPTLRNYP